MNKTLLCAAAALSLATSAAHAEAINVLVEGGGRSLQQAAADAFAKETGIEVNFVEVPYQGVFDKLSAEIASGTSNYDVATIDVVWNAAFAPHVEDLSALFTDAVKADIPPALLAHAKVGGKTMGMPAWANAEIVFYRKDLWEDPANKAAFKATTWRRRPPGSNGATWRSSSPGTACSAPT